MKTSLSHLYEKVRASAWTIPAVFSIAAIILAQVSIWADEMLRWSDLSWCAWIKPSSAVAAKTLLSTIAASMLAIAGVSFSSIMVTMALASQQFGPRLLRNFLKDKLSQTVLGALIGTFVFCIFIIRGIKSEEGAMYVPQISTILALLFALLCLALFIRFVHHILSEIQAEEVCHSAFLVVEETIDSMFPEEGEGPTEQSATPWSDKGWEVVAGKTGYVQAVKMEDLVTLAKEYDLLVQVTCRPGHFVSRGQAVVRIMGGPEPDEAEVEMIAGIQEAFFLGPVRTPEQDFEYGIRQLVEVALRALSPGVNDPFTAMNCIDYLGAGVQSAFTRPLPASVHRDDESNVRVVTPASSYRSLLEAAINQIRQDANDRCDVSCHLLEMLTQVARVAITPEQQEAIHEQAVLINQDTLPALRNEHDCEAIRSRFAALLNSCHLIDPFNHA